MIVFGDGLGGGYYKSNAGGYMKIMKKLEKRKERIGGDKPLRIE